MELKCKICGNQEKNKMHIAREMVFGFREEFEYLECSKCKCLQIIDIPENMNKYYPPTYYSFNFKPEEEYKKFKKRLKFSYADSYLLTQKGIIGKYLVKKERFKRHKEFYYFLINRINKSQKILDIGCGSGNLLYCLKNAGFKKVMGVDPYLDKTIKYKNGLVIEKKQLAELSGKWDFVMLNHAFEHMDNPLEVIKNIFNLLEDDGCCMINVPVVTSYAWKHYGTDWISLDAPRHFFLHAADSIKILAEQSGLVVDEIEYEHTAPSLYLSEQYKKDIPLMAGISHAINPRCSTFTEEEINEYNRKLKDIPIEQADCARFFLRKA